MEKKPLRKFGLGREARHGSLESYVTGFVLSLVLTLAAYFAVVNDVLKGKAVIAAIIILAIAQLLVQLVFFLHIDRERKPRHMLLIFLFMLIVLAIVVGGSLWIMESLDYNMMSHETDEFIIEDEGFPY
jgi:cytochrome o ubiquinol oxidase operon protein cyoD